MKKVDLDVLKPWIEKRVTEILTFEDDVVIEFIYNSLSEKQVSFWEKFFTILQFITIIEIYTFL